MPFTIEDILSFSEEFLDKLEEKESQGIFVTIQPRIFLQFDSSTYERL